MVTTIINSTTATAAGQYGPSNKSQQDSKTQQSGDSLLTTSEIYKEK